MPIEPQTIRWCWLRVLRTAVCYGRSSSSSLRQKTPRPSSTIIASPRPLRQSRMSWPSRSLSPFLCRHLWSRSRRSRRGRPSWPTTPHPLAFPISQFLELPPPGLGKADFDQPLIEEESDNIRGDRSQTRSPRARRKQGSPKFSIGYAGISHGRFGSCRSWQRPALALQPLASVRYGHPQHIASIFLHRRDCGASSRLCCLGTSQISIRRSQIVRNGGRCPT